MGYVPLYHALFTALSEQNSKDITEAKEFIKKEIRKDLITLTRIIYNPKEKAEIINNVGMDDEYRVRGNFLGESEWYRIEYKKDQESLKNALLGTNDSIKK